MKKILLHLHRFYLLLCLGTVYLLRLFVLFCLKDGKNLALCSAYVSLIACTLGVLFTSMILLGIAELLAVVAIVIAIKNRLYIN